MALPSLSPRDCQAYRDDGIKISCTSNEAVKLLDQGLQQYMAWCEDPALGGLAGTMEKMMECDPSFIMGRVLQLGLGLFSADHSPRLDPDLYATIKQLKTDAMERGTVGEQLHTAALLNWAEGKLNEASQLWQKQLEKCPKDLLALKLDYDTHFNTGQFEKIRDTVTTALANWGDKTSPFYGYMQGMLAFGLEETDDYAGAHRSAEAALERNRHDAWAVHAKAHCFEMLGEQEAGIEFMTRNQDNWSVCGTLAGHNFWHLALYHLEKGNHQEVLDLYDSLIGSGLKTRSMMLDVVDSASLLQRMEFEGINVGSRWEDVSTACSPHCGDHMLPFTDSHIMMGMLGANKYEDVEAMLNSQSNAVGWYSDSYIAQTFQKCGIPMCQGMKAYAVGDYDLCVELMAPIRKDIVKVGGSSAQRDVFNQYILNACLNSSNEANHKLANTLLLERKAQRPNSGITDRLQAKLLIKHQD